VLYFTAEREPAWWAASGLMAAGAIAAVRHPVAFVLGLGFFAIAAGFAVATLKTVVIDHSVLRYPAYSVSLAGFVELREESQKTDRVLRVERIDGTRIAGKPQRVRISVRRGMAPPAGAFVEVKAQLNPPLQPLRADGRLAFHHAGGDAFAIHEWLAADSDGRDARDPGLGNGISCDPSGCIGKLADGRLVAYALGTDSFEEDCRHATLIVATREAPPDCAATVIGRSLWRARGALVLHRDGAGFVIDSARPPNFDRPWAPNVAPQPARTAAANADAAAVPPAASRSQPRDATPRPEDLDPND
jgi:hypothetical protein